MKRAVSREHRMTVIYGILCLVMILVVLQLWLLVATMNASLGGESGVVWPAAAASVVCFLLNLGLLRYLYRLEVPGRRSRSQRRPLGCGLRSPR